MSLLLLVNNLTSVCPEGYPVIKKDAFHLSTKCQSHTLLTLDVVAASDRSMNAPPHHVDFPATRFGCPVQGCIEVYESFNALKRHFNDHMQPNTCPFGCELSDDEYLAKHMMSKACDEMFDAPPDEPMHADGVSHIRHCIGFSLFDPFCMGAQAWSAWIARSDRELDIQAPRTPEE